MLFPLRNAVLKEQVTVYFACPSSPFRISEVVSDAAAT